MLNPLTDNNGEISISQIPISQIYEKFGPGAMYVYDANRIIDNYNRIKNAMSDSQSRFRTKIFFAVKSNSNPAIVKLLKDVGAGADCANFNEMQIAKRAEVEYKDMLFSGNNNLVGELILAYEKKVAINFDDINLFDMLAKRVENKFDDRVIAFRYNPGVGLGENEKITTAGKDSKFGMSEKDIIFAFSRAKEIGVTRFGLHMMTGSNTRDADPFVWQIRSQLELAGKLCKELGIKLEFINIGGGFGIPYSEDAHGLDIDVLGSRIINEYYNKCKEFGVVGPMGIPDLILEPGRYIVGDAGVLISAVTNVKHSFGRRIIGIDASMATMLRPAMYDSYHHVYFDKVTGNNNAPADVVGQACENSDFFARDRLIAGNVKVGDLAVIATCGAYGYVMSSNYCNMTRPAEVLILSGKMHLIRERESFEQMLDRTILI